MISSGRFIDFVKDKEEDLMVSLAPEVASQEPQGLPLVVKA